MLVIIFSYNREEKLHSLLGELLGHEVIVIDDGSEYFKTAFTHAKVDSVMHQIIKTPHEGKKGFWKKWVMARQLALGSNHDYFLFLPDDIIELNLPEIELMTKGHWDEAHFAVNVINCNRTSCWGQYTVFQEDIELEETILKEVGFVDCGFLTNRTTLERIDVHEVHAKWFDRPDKSSGVGYQMTHSMRRIGASMMMPFPGLCYHGDHESVMHPKLREQQPLKSRRTRKIR